MANLGTFPTLLETNAVVINLSTTFVLTADMKSLLEKNFSFCPSPIETANDQIMVGVDKYLRQVKRTVFFNTPKDPIDPSNPFISMLSSQSSSSNANLPFDHSAFRNPSNFNPTSEQMPTLDTYCKTIKHRVYTSPGNQFRFHNLTVGERQALKELRDNPEIVIKPADKGGLVVVMDTTMYIAEVKRQLANTNHYRPLLVDPTTQHNDKVLKAVNEMLWNGSITEKVADFLVFTKPRTACLYILPKMHKPERPPPGRPIVSANQCPTERISRLVDHILRPYVPFLPSYIRDSPHLIQKIDSLPPLPEGALLVSLDVKSLYTQILTTEAVRVAKATLSTHRSTDELPTNLEILRLLALVLTCNNFEFNGQHFLQIQGVAMGTGCAPTIANLVMGDFEDKFVYTYPLKPLIWYRFIDDIFMIWTHGPSALNAFITHLNSVHRTLKFTHEVSDSSLSFLDTLIKKDQDGKLYTDLYSKPTDTHAYLHYSSCHPKHQKTGGPYSQLLRIRRICTKDTDFELHAHTILGFYKARGYPDSLLEDSLTRVRTQNRSVLLQPINPTISQQDSPLLCILPYNPCNPPVRGIINDESPILHTDPKLTCVASKRVILGHRRAKNLKDILVHSRLRYPPTIPNPIVTNSINPAKVCNNQYCRYCPKLDHSGKVKSPSTGKSYIVPQKFTCRFNNLIYVISCKKCKSQYVGQTKVTLMQRFQKHLKDIEHCANWDNAPPSIKSKGPTNVGYHFSLPRHSVDDVQIQVLEFIKSHPDSVDAKERRDDRETHWMYKLKSLAPLGINATDGSNHSRSRPNRPRQVIVDDQNSQS